ncbi:MAG: hypothetical protein DMF53_05530 [Acidobacteria bacterium]|nr:MAG: hypothetical protein DMF53_05530 [Acidobacteriota bacterium]
MSKSPYNAIAEWDTLLQAVKETEGDLAGVVPFREALANARARAHMFKGLQDSLEASAGEATDRLRETVAVGEDAVVALRSFIRGVLGMRNEKLLRYGIKPRGKRRGPKRTLSPPPPVARKRAGGRSR